MFWKYSIIDNWNPKHNPKNGILLILAYSIAYFFALTPKSPNPPGTIIASILFNFSYSLFFLLSKSGEYMNIISICFFNKTEANFILSTIDKYESFFAIYFPMIAILFFFSGANFLKSLKDFKYLLIFVIFLVLAYLFKPKKFNSSKSNFSLHNLLGIE